MAVERFAEDLARFSLGGFAVMRCNPDKTIAIPQRTLGFAGTIDISDVLDATNKAPIAIKLNGGAWVEKIVDFTDATPAALTVPNAVTALNEAGFDGSVTFSVDTATGRLMAAANQANPLRIDNPNIEAQQEALMADPQYINTLQIKSKLAGALDFGQSRTHGGFGVYRLTYLADKTISLSMPLDVKEAEDIDMESADGTLQRMSIPGKNIGTSPVVTLMYGNDEFLQIVQGGQYLPATTTLPAMYTPPSGSDKPLFVLDAFFPLYAPGTVSKSAIRAMDRRILWQVSATEGEVSAEAKSWAQFAFNMKATEYTNENGVKFPDTARLKYSFTQFELLDLYNL
jgi:hypothetical protein